jgi:hypothetical protein
MEAKKFYTLEEQKGKDMNVKIQGGGNGTYANTGSCVAVTNYLQHEDLERMKKGEEVQPFFNQFRDYVSAREVTFKIDNNKAKLSRTDAKFYVITVSPSEKELRCMGGTPQERAEALRRYIRQDVMRNYAEGFGKGLRSDDVEYYAKIHFNRDGDSDSDMHAHIIVSRKDRSNTRKLSPKTNHTGKKNCGNVKGSFDRTDFFRKCESSFDRRMGFDREPEESFDYLNAVKNGNPAEIARQVERAQRIRKEKWDNLKTELQTRQEPEMSKIRQVEKTPDIEQPTPKKQQEEDLELRQKPKKSKFILHKLFGNIVYRAEFHAFHGGINFGVVGHNDEGLHLSLLSHPAQKVYATAVRQTQVGNHDIIICCLLQMFLRG